MLKHYDYCILGAGLAGISLAHELSKRNATVCLIDPNRIAGGASGTPLGLVNPATGRYATLSWEAEKCYQAIKENLELVQSQTPVQFYKESGVLRPALDEKIATRMRTNFETAKWPKDWCFWFNENEVKNFHPDISCVGGGVWLPIGITVDMSTFLKSFVEYLKPEGVDSFTGIDYKLDRLESSWNIRFQNGSSVIADNVIFTNGISAKETLNTHPKMLIPVKGQLAVLKANTPLGFKHAVSALGYTASISKESFVVGSTYEHNFEHDGIDQKGLDYLLTRFEKVLPKLKGSYEVLSQWSGIRASTPDRMPVMGAHPELMNAYIYAGLGSKGLLYSGYLAELMTDYLLDKSPLANQLDIKRFLA